MTTATETEKTTEAMTQFSQLQTREDVAVWLAILEKSLRYFLYGKRVENLYTEFQIPKKGGGTRKIRAPQNQLKTIQRKLTSKLSEVYAPRYCTYGFIADKNIIGNAQNHVKSRCILNIDLKDFFEQIHIGRIVGLLTTKPYSIGNEAAVTIAQIACYYKKNSKTSLLPQGAPTSPIISNMICSSLDAHMMRFAKKHHLRYTRYADDISLSTRKRQFEPEIAILEEDGRVVLGVELRAIFSRSNFAINEEKLKIRSQDLRQEVTGLVVNTKVNVKREYVDIVRSILHHCEKDGIYITALAYLDKGLCSNPKVLEKRDDQDCIERYLFSVLKGKLSFIKQVRGKGDELFIRYAEQANQVFSDEKFGQMFDLTYALLQNVVLAKNVFVLYSEFEENEELYMIQGSGFYTEGYGLITNYHVIEHLISHKTTMAVYYPSKYEQAAECIVSESKVFYSSRDIDYTIFNIRPNESITELKIGDSTALKSGDQVTIAGFPNYQKRDSIYTEVCRLTQSTTFLGAPLWKVDGRIVHGMSGGIVLNDKVEVVGIIKGGVASLSEESTNDMQGFVPFHCVLEDIDKKQKENINADTQL